MSVLECLKATWDLGLDEEAWFREVGSTLVPLFESLGGDLGVLAIDFAWAEDGRVEFRPRLHLETEIASEEVLAFVRAPPDYDAMAAFFRRAPWGGTIVEMFQNEPNSEHVLENAKKLRVTDTVGLVGGDAAGGTQFFSMSSQVIELGTQERWLIAGLTAHLAAAHRVRRDITAGAAVRPDDADAVFSADGDFVHGEDSADHVGDVRDRLRAAIVEQRNSRDARTLSPGQALDSWASLVDGRYSIVDHFEERGRRLFLLYENPYFFRSPRALSPRQRDAVALAARGHGNRAIGLMLGLSPSTVASHLAAAQSKLGLARADLCRYLDWENAAVVEHSSSEESLRSLEIKRASLDLGVLTEAEKDVAQRAAQGASNDEIAAARGSRPRTVANQLASVYSKLGINSRYELANVID